MHVFYLNPIFPELNKLSKQLIHHCCCRLRGHPTCEYWLSLICAVLNKLAEDRDYIAAPAECKTLHMCIHTGFIFAELNKLVGNLGLCTWRCWFYTKKNLICIFCSGPIFAELNKLAEDSDLRQEEEQQQQPPQLAMQSDQQQGMFGQQAGSEASHAPLDLNQVSMLTWHVLTSC